MDKKRKIIITAIIALVVFTVILVLFTAPPKKPYQDTSVKVTLPDAQVEALPKAKIKAYENEEKATSYDKLLSEIAISSTGEDTVNTKAMQMHAQATQRLSQRIQSENSGELREESGSEPINSHTTGYVLANKDNWKERYDYLYEKLYGDLEHPSSEQTPQPNETHQAKPVPTPAPAREEAGFITITVGTSQATDKGVFKVSITTEQKIKSGDKVQLRLLKDAYLQDEKIDRNTYIYAIAKIEDNRLQLIVSSVSKNTKAIPCSLAAYDTDGYKGLAFTSDDSSQQISNEVKSALQTTVGQLAAITSRTAGNIMRSTSRIGSNAIGNKQQTITLPANYMMQLK
jgi:hypothetical protein